VETYDVVIIGGGIQGTGVAQAVAARGYRALLIEQASLAAGTSSRSSKLIHGGLRYLEQGELGLVRESLSERRLLLRNAPDLVELVPFMIPVYAHAKRSPFWIRLGLIAYALLGGGAFRSIPGAQWHELDGIKQAGLRAVFQYQDAKTDDSKLTHAVMQSAIELGARLAMPAHFISATDEGNVWRIEYKEAEAIKTVISRTLVNAAGPWVNQVLSHIEPTMQPPQIQWVQGTHILLDGEVKRGVYYLEHPGDHRPILMMPWNKRILVGTTERVYEGDPAKVEPLPEETDYLLEAVKCYFPDRRFTVHACFSGLRVLPIEKGACIVCANP